MAFKLTSGPNALKISKAQQTTILEVLIASLLVGAAFMFSIWLIRYISFNTKVITAKGESVDNYEASVINTGACDDSNGDGKLSDSELDSCTPDSTPLATVPSSLRSNVMVTTANSPALESVQRSLASSCYDAYGEGVIRERHRHRYEFNNAYRKRFEDAGLRIAGINPKRDLVEIVEVSGHPWMVGVQFHPEFQSKPSRPHPLFCAFVGQALKRSKASKK